MSAATDPIQHVVVLMLENRSFDQMLGSLQDVVPGLAGIDPDRPRENEAEGRCYRQEPNAAFELPPKMDPKHEHDDVMAQLDRPSPNGGFVANFIHRVHEHAAHAQQVMDYYDHVPQRDPQVPRIGNRLPALHALAENFLVCDRWYSSVPGPTWPNRFFLLSGTSNGRVHMPRGFRHWHLYDQTTVFDRLNEAGVPWKVYHGDFPLSLLLTHQLRPKNLRHYERMDAFHRAAQGPATDFPAFAFIEPDYLGKDRNDQHPPSDVRKGDALIGDVYRAIRSNEALWRSTLLLVLYDEHGGFYDHVYPTEATPPDGLRGDGFAFDRYGVRVPAVLISPWVRQGVDHTPFDHTSVLKYLQEKWGLGPLGARTAAAHSLAPLIQAAPAPAAPEAVPVARIVDEEVRELDDLQHVIMDLSAELERRTATSPAATFVRPLRMAASPVDAQSVAMERLQDFMAQHRAAPEERAEEAPDDPALRFPRALRSLRSASTAVRAEGRGRMRLHATPAEAVELAVGGPFSPAALEFLAAQGLPPAALLGELRLTLPLFQLPWPLRAGTPAESGPALLAWTYLAEVEEHLQQHVRVRFGPGPVRVMIVGAAAEGPLVLAAILIDLSAVEAPGTRAGHDTVREDQLRLRDDVRQGLPWMQERTRELQDALRAER